jgi:head-tail adaptor
MSFHAGILRRRVNIQERIESQNQESGAIESRWELVFENEPAAIEPLSVKDFIAAKAAQSEISVRVTLRWHPEFEAPRTDGRIGPREFRIVEGAKVYWPAGFKPDRKYGDEFVVAPCSENLEYT